MTDPRASEQADGLEPVHAVEEREHDFRWTGRLILFLRLMAAVSMVKGLYHWSRVLGIGVTPNEMYAIQPIAWQTATVFFAVIDLVAAVGLWLAAAWGAVVWLTSVASMIAVGLFFSQVFGNGMMLGSFEGALLASYLLLALKSAQEQPA